MNRPAAVIDKSLLQEICEQNADKRNELFEVLFARYRVVVPSVLIEEIWVNLAKVGDGTLPIVLANMKDFVIRLHDSWIDDPLEIAFRELIKGERVVPLPRPPQNLIYSFTMLRPGDVALTKWVEERTKIAKNNTRRRVKSYSEILPVEKFATIKNGQDFFDKIIRSKFVEMIYDPIRKRLFLENELGLAFRANHPEWRFEIDKAFDAYSGDTFEKFQATLVCLIAAISYFYAALCKIGSSDGRSQPFKILGRGNNDQSNNFTDLRYVQSALLCDRLLTRDQGMYNVINLLRDCGFWDGRPILINPKKDLAIQILNDLI